MVFLFSLRVVCCGKWRCLDAFITAAESRQVKCRAARQVASSETRSAIILGLLFGARVAWRCATKFESGQLFVGCCCCFFFFINRILCKLNFTPIFFIVIWIANNLFPFDFSLVGTWFHHYWKPVIKFTWTLSAAMKTWKNNRLHLLHAQANIASSALVSTPFAKHGRYLRSRFAHQQALRRQKTTRKRGNDQYTIN